MGYDFVDPHRIGLSKATSANFRRKVSEYDEIAINHVITHLMEKVYNCLFLNPNISRLIWSASCRI